MIIPPNFDIIAASEMFCKRLEEACQDSLQSEPLREYLQKHSRNTGAAKLKRAAKHAKRNRK